MDGGCGTGGGGMSGGGCDTGGGGGGFSSGGGGGGFSSGGGGGDGFSSGGGGGFSGGGTDFGAGTGYPPAGGGGFSHTGQPGFNDYNTNSHTHASAVPLAPVYHTGAYPGGMQYTHAGTPAAPYMGGTTIGNTTYVGQPGHVGAVTVGRRRTGMAAPAFMIAMIIVCTFIIVIIPVIVMVVIISRV